MISTAFNFVLGLVILASCCIIIPLGVIAVAVGTMSVNLLYSLQFSYESSETFARELLTHAKQRYNKFQR